METAYDRYLINEIDIRELCKSLATALNTLPFDGNSKDFTVQIANQKMNEKFFGMRVFPKIEELDDFCKDLIAEKSDKLVKFGDIIKRWKNIEYWYVELDSMLFDRYTINFTPKELVALTLHEIGHVIYSDKPIEGFYRSYKEANLRMKLADKATQKLMYNIYMIPLTIACMQREWVNGKNQVKVELIADQTVVDLGYGEYLVSALSKIIRQFGSINKNEDQQQQEIDTSVQWCNNNIADIVYRKDKLKDALYYQTIKTKSNYFKAVSIIVLDKLGFKMRERYTGFVVENSVELLSDPKVMTKYEPIIDALESAKFDRKLQLMISSEEMALESFFNKRKKTKVELPSQYEIDAISVEVDKMTNHHDRLYVLDLIYELLDRILTAEEVIARDPALMRKWGDKIQAMKDSLETLRVATLEKKVFTNKYKFFVSLPEEARDYAG